MTSATAGLVTALALFSSAAPGCKSQSEKEAAAWEEQFGALMRRYQALPQLGMPELPPEKVSGRNVLFAPRICGSDGPPVVEARQTTDVGIVILWSVVNDAVPSRTYEQGSKGYGGQVEIVAFAHPEAKRLARSTWHCTPPTTILRLVHLGSGAPAVSYDEHCTPGDRALREFAAALVKGRAPDGSNAGDDTRRAFDAIAADYRSKLDAPVGAPLDVHGRKLLLFYADDGGPLKLFHNEYLLHESVYADTAATVGIVGVERLTYENEPSTHYANGATGFMGRAELVLLGYPEGRVLSRTPLDCKLASEDIVVNVLATRSPQHCSGNADQIRAALARAIGPLPDNSKH